MLSRWVDSVVSGLRVVMCPFVVLAMLAVVGCTAPIESYFADLDPEGWYRGQEVVVELPNSDTLSLRDIVLVVKGDSGYDFDSLDLTILVKAPDGEQALFRTTLCTAGARMHTNMQEWEQPLIGGARLDKEGDYIFRIQHSATRKVEGLWAMGITQR